MRAGTLAIRVRHLTVDDLPSQHLRCEGGGGRSTRLELHAIVYGMTLRSSVTAAVAPGATLEKLSHRQTFEVAEYRDEAMVLLLGLQSQQDPDPLASLGGSGYVARVQGWTELGAGRWQPTSSESLNGFLDARIAALACQAWAGLRISRKPMT
jgi:hypothetical protein